MLTRKAGHRIRGGTLCQKLCSVLTTEHIKRISKKSDNVYILDLGIPRFRVWSLCKYSLNYNARRLKLQSRCFPCKLVARGAHGEANTMTWARGELYKAMTSVGGNPLTPTGGTSITQHPCTTCFRKLPGNQPITLKESPRSKAAQKKELPCSCFLCRPCKFPLNNLHRAPAFCLIHVFSRPFCFALFLTLLLLNPSIHPIHSTPGTSF